MKVYFRNAVERLNKHLRRPSEGWERDKVGKLTANVGHLALEAMSPGDGWTRYRLIEISNVDGGERNMTNAAYNSAEFTAFLEGVQVGLDLAAEAARRMVKGE